MNKADSAVLTVPEVARLLGVSRATAYQAVADGTIPAIRIGSRRLVVPRARFFEWLEDSGNPLGVAL